MTQELQDVALELLVCHVFGNTAEAIIINESFTKVNVQRGHTVAKDVVLHDEMWSLEAGRSQTNEDLRKELLSKACSCLILDFATGESELLEVVFVSSMSRPFLFCLTSVSLFIGLFFFVILLFFIVISLLFTLSLSFIIDLFSSLDFPSIDDMIEDIDRQARKSRHRRYRERPKLPY